MGTCTVLYCYESPTTLPYYLLNVYYDGRLNGGWTQINSKLIKLAHAMFSTKDHN